METLFKASTIVLSLQAYAIPTLIQQSEFRYKTPLQLEEMFPQDFVIETKRIVIPGFEEAFNPSITRWKGSLLLSFRFIPNPKDSFTSYFGLVFLDEQFQPIGPAQRLEIRDPDSSVPSRADDARLFQVGDTLYFIYSDNPKPKLSRAGFRVFIAELEHDGEKFFLQNKEPLLVFEGESKNKREKNWVPFNYEDNLLLAYSLNPHVIFYPILGSSECVTIAKTRTKTDWEFGELRGGTPALKIEDSYLAFFHSSIEMASSYSNGKKMLHYFMGAYLFSAAPPFQITHISPVPIIDRRFYTGQMYPPYWKPICCIFPVGLIDERPFLWVTYGRQDHEVWVAKIDREKLINSLQPIK